MIKTRAQVALQAEDEIAPCQGHMAIKAITRQGDDAKETTELQNIRSAMTSLRNLVKLMRAVGRERELDRQICCFSMAYIQKGFSVYGHDTSIEGENAQYYRHVVLRRSREGDFFRAYQFPLSVYSADGPKLHQLNVSAINQLLQTGGETTLIKDEALGG